MHLNNLVLTTLLATTTATAIPKLNTPTILKRNEVEWDKAGNIKLTCMPTPLIHSPKTRGS